jgi:hypothetical protein
MPVLGLRMIVRKTLPPTVWPVAGLLLGGLTLMAFGWQSAANAAALNSIDLKPSIYLAGRQINKLVPKDAKVMLSFPLEDYRFWSYVDRQWARVTTMAEFEALRGKDPTYRFYVLGPDGSSVSEELRRYLASVFPAQFCQEYTVFSLQGGERGIVTRDTGLVPSSAIRFGDSLELLRYELDAVASAPVSGPASFWENHFNAHAELMPEHRGRFTVTYFWHCLKPLPANYQFRVQFVSDYGDDAVIDQTHQPGNGAYPTTLWREGDVIREQYTVEVPPDMPPMRYALHLSVVDPAHDTVLKPRQPATGDASEVILGSVDISPREPPAGLEARPAMAEQVSVDLGDNLELQGYGLSGGRTLAAGRSLKVDTAWLCRGPVSGDHLAWLELANGKVLVRAMLGVEPTRLWQAGKYYVRPGELALSSYLLPGRYALSVTMGDGQARAGLGEVEVTAGSERRWVLGQLGAPNESKADMRPLDTDRTLQLRFGLEHPAELEVVAGWTGEALCAATRVEVHIANGAGERYLRTWVVPRGRYTVERLTIPREATAAGVNVVNLQVAATQPKPHYVGWRAWVDAILPDLLYDTSGPYDGWVWADFVEVNAGAMRAEWAAYRDLARAYAGWSMNQEVASVFSAARGAGLEPQRLDDLNVFLPAAQTAGDLASGLEAVVRSQVPHWAGVNLGGQVEYLGYGLRRLDGSRAELTLYFRALSQTDGDYTVWLHQSAESNLERSVALDHSLGTSTWKPGEVHEDTQTVNLEAGKVRFVFGLWRGDDASRLQVRGQSGQHEIDLGWVEPDL